MSELDKMINSIPRGERVVIGADFNGHVAKENRGNEKAIGRFKVNKINTYIQKKENHQVTYEWE